jgi:hypothetical protein
MTDRARAMLEGLKAPKPDGGEIAHADKLVEAFWKSEKGERICVLGSGRLLHRDRARRQTLVVAWHESHSARDSSLFSKPS